MNIFCIADSVEDEFWGPYTDENLADKVLKIVKMAVDEGSEMRIVESDQYADQLRAGLLPFKICVELLGNQVRNTEVKLAWPPSCHRRHSAAEGGIHGVLCLGCIPGRGQGEARQPAKTP
jgi:hypothetical protein